MVEAAPSLPLVLLTSPFSSPNAQVFPVLHEWLWVLEAQGPREAASKDGHGERSGSGGVRAVVTSPGKDSVTRRLLTRERQNIHTKVWFSCKGQTAQEEGSCRK